MIWALGPLWPSPGRQASLFGIHLSGSRHFSLPLNIFEGFSTLSICLLFLCFMLNLSELSSLTERIVCHQNHFNLKLGFIHLFQYFLCCYFVCLHTSFCYTACCSTLRKIHLDTASVRLQPKAKGEVSEALQLNNQTSITALSNVTTGQHIAHLCVHTAALGGTCVSKAVTFVPADSA